MRFGELQVTTFGALTAALLSSASAWAMEYKEAPTLAEKVAAGELPPVEERLPEDPEVITPYESLGTYGGEINFGSRAIPTRTR